MQNLTISRTKRGYALARLAIRPDRTNGRRKAALLVNFINGRLERHRESQSDHLLCPEMSGPFMGIVPGTGRVVKYRLAARGFFRF